MKKRKVPRSAAPKERGARTCCACRESAPRDSLLRFVVDHEGRAWLDPYLRAPGRGAHLCYRRACLERAVKKNSLSSSLKSPARLPALLDLVERITQAQEQKVRDLIALSQKRRVNLTGLNILEDQLKSVHLLILATDISEGSRARLEGRLSPDVTVATPPFSPQLDPTPIDSESLTQRHTGQFSWNSADLGSLIGREARVAIGITDPKLASRLNLEISRISQVLVAS